MLVIRRNPERLEKAKYIKRWKGKDGKWKYLYKKSSKQYSKKPVENNKPQKMSREDLPDNIIYHTSPSKIEKIKDRKGNFKDSLFFSADEYSMSSGKTTTYAMDIDNMEFLSPSQFFYDDDYEKLNDIVSDVENYADVDNEMAQGLLDGSEDPFEIIEDGEMAGDLSWFIQGKQGESAKILGYDGAESEDEQGTVYIVPMIGRESDLIEVVEDMGKSMLVIGMKQAHQKLAEKHGVSVSKIEKEIRIGEKEELEHTSDKLEAHKIAMDHIFEDPEYYKKLSEAGLVEKAVKDLNSWKKKLSAILSGEKMSKSLFLRKGKSYPIGTKRTWSGKDYKKVAGGVSGKGKWVRTYTKTEGRGEKQAIRNVMRKIQSASSMEDLAQIISENMSRFKDDSGKTLPVVKEFMSAARGTESGKKKEKVPSTGRILKDTPSSDEILTMLKEKGLYTAKRHASHVAPYEDIKATEEAIRRGENVKQNKEFLKEDVEDLVGSIKDHPGEKEEVKIPDNASSSFKNNAEHAVKNGIDYKIETNRYTKKEEVVYLGTPEEYTAQKDKKTFSDMNDDPVFLTEDQKNSGVSISYPINRSVTIPVAGDPGVSSVVQYEIKPTKQKIVVKKESNIVDFPRKPPTAQEINDKAKKQALQSIANRSGMTLEEVQKISDDFKENNPRKKINIQDIEADVARIKDDQNKDPVDSPEIKEAKNKIRLLQKNQKTMKDVNKIVKNKKMSDEEKIKSLGEDFNLPEHKARGLMEPDFAGRVGFASYQLTNNNAKIKAAINKITDLERRSQQKEAFKPISFDGGSIDIQDDRVVIDHDVKPDRDTISRLKGRGFRWTPSIGSWTRKHTRQAVIDAKQVMNVPLSKSMYMVKDGRLLKAKYISKKYINGKWVYKYTEGSRQAAGPDKPKQMIPAGKFNAGDYFTKTNDPNATPESVMKHATPEVKAKIAATEAKLKNITPTINKYRKINGEGAAAVYSPERQKIHESIIMKMFTSDKMAKAMPEAGKQPTFTMLGGRGGSGKSWFNGKVYDPNTTIVMDSDEIKGQLPEYEGWNAFEVHEESSDILEKAVAMAKEYGLNIVIDATMKTTSSAVERVLDFKKAGYDIKAHYMHAPRHISAQRAVSRFGGKSGRYVPVGVVLSNVSNEKTFDAVKNYASSWSFHDSSGNPPPDLISKKNGALKLAKAIENSSKSVKADPHDMYDFGPVTDPKDYSDDLKRMIEKNRPTVKKSRIVVRNGLSGKK